MPYPLTSLRIAAVATALCLALIEIRFHVTGTRQYAFLTWNLFLAWLPALFAIAAARLRSVGAGRGLYLSTALLWLLFLPNAPYLVTDFAHLGMVEGTGHLWIDVPMLAYAAVAGMVLGLASLRSFHAVVAERFGAPAGWTFVAIISALVGAGLYLGRVGRFNSWQLVSDPHAILARIGPRLADPGAHLRLVVVIWLCALLFGGIYVLVCRWESALLGSVDRRRPPGTESPHW